MSSKRLETAIFMVWLATGHAVILYGRWLFITFSKQEDQIGVLPGASALVVTLLASGLFGVLRIASLSLRKKMVIGLAVAVLGSILAPVVGGSHSLLAFMLHFYLFFAALVAVGLYDCFDRTMRPEFWTLLFEHMVKLIQYFLAILVAGTAVLRYVRPEGSNDVFRADLATCLAVFVFSFMLVAYWVMLPIWLRVLEGYATDHSASMPPTPDDESNQTADRREKVSSETP